MNWLSSSEYFLVYILLTHFSISVSQRVQYRCGFSGSRHKLQSSPVVVYEKEGSDMVLRVTDQGDSSVEWMATKGTALISQKDLSQRLLGSGANNIYGRLTVRSVDKMMNGTIYKYALKSSNGRTVFESAWLTLIIAEVPTVRYHRLARTLITVKEEGNEEICVNVTGIPEPHINIFKKGIAHEASSWSRFKPSTESGCFRISNLVEEDSGQYIISAENCVGNSTLSFTIAVLPTPCYKHLYLPDDMTKEVILWGDQNKIHGCRENIVGAKTTTVYVLEGHHVTMKAVVKNKGKSDTIVRWIGRKGLAKVTEKELRNQLVSHRVDIDDDKGHIILKAVDRKLNGTQYRYVEYQNEHIISQSAWALLVIGSVPEVGLTSHHLTKRLNVTEGESLPRICFSVSGTPYPNISLYQFTASKLEPQRVEQKRYTFSGDCLHVGPVSRADSGKLAIVASNCFGSSALVLELTILLPYPCSDRSDVKPSPLTTDAPRPVTSQKDAGQKSLTSAPTVIWKIQDPVTVDFVQQTSPVNQLSTRPVTTSERTSRAVSGGLFSPIALQKTREPSQMATQLDRVGFGLNTRTTPRTTDSRYDPDPSQSYQHGSTKRHPDLDHSSNLKSSGVTQKPSTNAIIRHPTGRAKPRKFDVNRRHSTDRALQTDPALLVKGVDVADTTDPADNWNTDIDGGMLSTNLPTLEPPDFQGPIDDSDPDSSGFQPSDVTIPPGDSVNNEQQNHDRSGSLEEFPPWAYAVIATVALVLAVALAITGIVIKRRAQIPAPIAKEDPGPDPNNACPGPDPNNTCQEMKQPEQ